MMHLIYTNNIPQYIVDYGFDDCGSMPALVGVVSRMVGSPL